MVYTVEATGAMDSSEIESNSAFRPSISLESGSNITEGEGTKEKPYVIAVN